MAQIREINAVLGEALGILSQPEFLQPFRDRLHSGPRSPVPDFFVFGAGENENPRTTRSLSDLYGTMVPCVSPVCEMLHTIANEPIKGMEPGGVLYHGR